MSNQGNDEFSSEKSKGLNLPEFLHSLVGYARKSLLSWGAEGDFDQLCGKGCSEVSLAVAFWSFELALSVERMWRKTIPSARRRQQVVRTLDNAADVLQELQSLLDLAVFEEAKKSLPGNPRESATSDREVLNIISRIEPAWSSYAPAPSPATMIRGLRLYARTLNLFRAMSEETQAHSFDSVPRYLISAYVKQATGDFNDARVSALIGGALGTGSYDETAHCMWRSRNYKRLEKEYAFLVHILADIGAITGPNA